MKINIPTFSFSVYNTLIYKDYSFIPKIKNLE